MMVLMNNLFVMCTVVLNVKLVSRDYNKLLNSAHIFHVLTFWHIENFEIQIGYEYSERKAIVNVW